MSPTQEESPRQEEAPIDWVTRLDRAGSMIHARMENLHLHCSSEDELEVARAAKAMLHVIVSQATAVRRLIGTENSAAAGPNLRTMFECAIELRYLLLHGDRAINARKMKLLAILEYRGFLDGLADDDEDIRKARAELDSQLDAIRQRDPTSVAEVESRRFGHHYSRQSHTNLVREVGDQLEDDGWLPRVYRVLSWDTHGTLAGLLNVREFEQEGEIIHRHAYPLTPEESTANAAENASRILMHSWEVFCTGFGLSLLPDRD